MRRRVEQEWVEEQPGACLKETGTESEAGRGTGGETVVTGPGASQLEIHDAQEAGAIPETDAAEATVTGSLGVEHRVQWVCGWLMTTCPLYFDWTTLELVSSSTHLIPPH